MHIRLFATATLAALAALATPSSIASVFPHTPESRPVPRAGALQADVLAAFGRPTDTLVTQHFGDSAVSVWDFGTFRVFFKEGRVVESRRW
ncbi:MAG: hypothetical protein AAGA11_09960 [Pseudomonadota bacterium]